jgi:hypothetical protein
MAKQILKDAVIKNIKPGLKDIRLSDGSTCIYSLNRTARNGGVLIIALVASVKRYPGRVSGYRVVRRKKQGE